MKKVKFSRVLAVMLALVITVGAVPLTALPASAATTHSHPVCGSSCKCADDSHSNLTWTEWNGTTKMYNGNYYLTKDVVLSSTMVLDYSYTSRLCLNGYSITCEDRVFDIYSYRSLIITDCKGTGRVETTGYDCTIGNNKYLSVWGGTILNTYGWSAIESYPNTNTYVCGGNIEGEYAIFTHPNANVYVNGGTVKGYYYAITGNDQSGITITGKVVVSGGTLTAIQKGSAVDIQSGHFTMTGGTIDGGLTVFPEYSTTTISGGKIDFFDIEGKNISITGGTLGSDGQTSWFFGENVDIAAGTFKGDLKLMADSCNVRGGKFADCSSVLVDGTGKAWIYGGSFDKITAYSSLYLSGIPEINTLIVKKPGVVSAQSIDASGSYGGETVNVITDNEVTTWKDGNIVIKNVKSDAAAQKFVYGGEDSEWISLERYNNNLVLREIPHGSCGNDAYWGIKDNTLYIYGTGTITYNYSGTKYPWGEYTDQINRIVVEEGITEIPAYTFEYCGLATTITLPETLTKVHLSAFNDCESLNNLLLPSSLKTIDYYNCYINRCYSLTDLYYLGTQQELSALLNGSTLKNWGDNPVLKVHCLEKREGSSTCTEGGTGSYYQFDDTSVYGGMYDMDKKPITTVGTVPALGHDEIHHNAKAPTCTEVGWEEYVTCSRCDYTTYTELATVDHEYEGGVCIHCGAAGVPEGLVYNFFDAVLITDYTGSATELVIPDTIGGYPVISIDSGAFSGCETLTKVVLPDSIRYIGSGAFSNCKNLTSINIPTGVTSIVSYTFDRCEKLENITIPEGVTSIGEGAFEHCYSLESLIIPNSVETIGYGAFSNCENLNSIILPDKITSIENRLFFGCRKLANITIPEGVTSIGESGFEYCYSLESINIPVGVTTIERDAFSDCTSLRSIKIPDSVTSIGECAFNNCESITEIVLPGGITSIEDRLLFGCEKLVNVTIPEGLTSIGDRAFRGCTSLTSITLPEGVTSIGSWAFSECTSLTSITLPDGITSIAEGTFYSCDYLENVSLPEGLTSIGNNAFQYCESLTSITIPEGVTSIGDYAFYACTSLTSITIPEGVTSIGNKAFYNCTSLTSITLPEGLTSIGNYAFDYCSSLTSITIPEGVTSIGNNAFYHCESLTSITLPEGLTSIGNWAFFYCTSLTSITLPEGVTSINDYAFGECYNLTSITLPEGVTSIGESAFWYCSSLTTVYYGGTREQWNSVSIGSSNAPLTDAEIIFLGESEEPEIILGDLDGDGKVNSKDVNLIKRLISGAIDPTESQKKAADVNGDGSLNALDANLMSKIAAGAN